MSEEERLYRLLPLSKEWRWRPYDFPQFQVQPGETKDLIDLRRHGWVVTGILIGSDPELSIIIELETGTEVYRSEVDMLTLYGAGLVQSSPSGWWISLYDTVANLYAANFTPSRWWPFYRSFKVSLRNPTDTVITVYRFGVLCIEFIKESSEV